MAVPKAKVQKITDRNAVRDQIARAIVPDAWKEYDEGNGVCSNMAGWACIESIHAAGRVVAALEKAGRLKPQPSA